MAGYQQGLLFDVAERTGTPVVCQRRPAQRHDALSDAALADFVRCLNVSHQKCSLCNRVFQHVIWRLFDEDVQIAVVQYVTTRT